MSQIEFNFDKDNWFQEEVTQALLKFMASVSDILLAVDMEVAQLVDQGYDETLVDKLERDIKASKVDEIQQALLSILD